MRGNVVKIASHQVHLDSVGSYNCGHSVNIPVRAVMLAVPTTTAKPRLRTCEYSLQSHVRNSSRFARIQGLAATFERENFVLRKIWNTTRTLFGCDARNCLSMVTWNPLSNTKTRQKVHTGAN